MVLPVFDLKTCNLWKNLFRGAHKNAFESESEPYCLLAEKYNKQSTCQTNCRLCGNHTANNIKSRH